MGWSRPTICQRSSVRMDSDLWIWSWCRPRLRPKTLTMSSGISDSTTILTGNPMSLSSRDSSTADMKSQASSMVTLTSALRVTLKQYAPSTVRPGNSEEMWFSMMSSMNTYTSSLLICVGILTNLGSTPMGTLTLAYMSWSLPCSFTAMFRALFEMNGNGWETSSPSGVSSAWTLSL